jgi:hypothetical protein
MTQPHGTETRYCSGCRCDDCRAGHAAGARRRRRAKAYGRHVPKSVPNVGVSRRVQALMCLGWSMRAQSRLLGWHPDRLGMMLIGDGVSPRNHARIAALYDRLWNTPPMVRTRGERISVSRTIALARRRGYQPPMAWDDDDIDDRAARSNVSARRGAWEPQPCGTAAAARRHYRRGEALDEACRAASRRQAAERSAAA